MARERGSGADDGIRTRDPHLGKVMRYQLRYVRVGNKLSGQRTPGDNRVDRDMRSPAAPDFGII
jgi:hypothetical protein